MLEANMMHREPPPPEMLDPTLAHKQARLDEALARVENLEQQMLKQQQAVAQEQSERKEQGELTASLAALQQRMDNRLTGTGPPLFPSTDSRLLHQYRAAASNQFHAQILEEAA